MIGFSRYKGTKAVLHEGKEISEQKKLSAVGDGGNAVLFYNNTIIDNTSIGTGYYKRNDGGSP